MSDYKIKVDVGSDYSLAVETAKINDNIDDLKMKITSVKKENDKNIVTFSDGKQMVVRDGATPYIGDDGYWYIDGKSTKVKARAEHSFKELTPEEKEEIKGDPGKQGVQGKQGKPGEDGSRIYTKKSDAVENARPNIDYYIDSLGRIGLITSTDNNEILWSGSSVVNLRGDTGEPIKITDTQVDSEGNVNVTFSDKTKIKIPKGKQGEKGDKGNTGNSVSVSSVTKSGLTNTVRFTDGKSLQVKDGESVIVSSYRFLTNGDTEVTFTDGNKVVIKKGVDGSTDFDKLTKEQKESLRLDVVNDLTSGGVDKALSAEQGKVLFQSVDNGKDLIAKAIIDKEGKASKDDSFSDLASKIKAIKIGYGVGDVIDPSNVRAKTVTKNSYYKYWEYQEEIGIIVSLSFDSQGSICGTSVNTFTKLSPDGKKISGNKFAKASANSSDRIIAILDNQGNIYTAELTGAVRKFSPDGNSIWGFNDSSGVVFSLSIDIKGNIYAGDDGGQIIKISSDGKLIKKFTMGDGSILSLKTDSQDNVYAGDAYGKIAKFSPDGKKLKDFTNANTPIAALALDSKDNIYFTSDDKITKLSPEDKKLWEMEFEYPKDEDYDEDDDDHLGNIISLAVDKDDNLYFGDTESKITKIKPVVKNTVTGYEVLK